MKRLLYILGFGLIATTVIIVAHQVNWGDSKNTVLNIFQGAYASTLVVLIFEFITELRLYKRLNLLAGQWTEHTINERTIGTQIGQGTIKYNGGNSLTITIAHGNRSWTGEILINKDCPYAGSISWSYDEQTEKEHEFGFKELIIPTERNTDKNSDYYFIYLIPTNKFDGYNKAVLMKKKASR